MGETKERILDVSLDLFSRNGFSAVSIRDICKEVQIKESSVYYHFQNKQAILDELLERFEKIADRMMTQLETALTEENEAPNDHFYETVCDCFFEQYLMDAFCNKVMRLMMIEQLGNVEVGKLYDRWMFHEPLQFQEKVFTMLQEKGFMKKMDSGYLAVKYYAPIYFFAQRWLLVGELSEEKKNAFRGDAYRHIQFFFSEMEGA